jgi:hypothetical protein
MTIDPNGAHINGTTSHTSGPGTSDEGVSIDPNG